MKRKAISADGVLLRRGSIIYMLTTKNAGKTWQIAQREVKRTNHRGMISFEDKPKLWYFAWPLQDQVGDHPTYSVHENATAEATRRNKEKHDVPRNVSGS